MVRLRPKSDINGARDAAAQIKIVARKLFADRGVDGVTIRDIAAAAGQKNHAAVGYYFGTKEALVREIVVDGAKLIDERRNLLLDALDAKGGPRSVREIVDILIYPSLDVVSQPGEEDNYVRFITMLVMSHRDLFTDALGNRWNSGYLRCLDHLRRLMPPMTAAAKNQRFIFMGVYLRSVVAARQTLLADSTRPHPTWASDQTLEHFARTVTALIEIPMEIDLPDGDKPRKGRRSKDDRLVPGPLG